MQPLPNQVLKTNIPIFLSFFGSVILIDSLFLPYLTFSFYQSAVTYDGFSSLAGFILILIAIGLSLTSIFTYHRSHFREEFKSSRNLTLFSGITGLLGIFFYIFGYENFTNTMKTNYNVNIVNLHLGLGFYGICLGTMIVGSSFIKINSTMNVYPSKRLSIPMSTPQNYRTTSYYQNSPKFSTQNSQSGSPQQMSLVQQSSNVIQRSQDSFQRCQNCGNQLPVDCTFCTTCGAKIN